MPEPLDLDADERQLAQLRTEYSMIVARGSSSEYTRKLGSILFDRMPAYIAALRAERAENHRLRENARTTLELEQRIAELEAEATQLTQLVAYERAGAEGRISELEAALQPFADYAARLEKWPDDTGCHCFSVSGEPMPKLTLGTCRRAAEALVRRGEGRG